MRHLANKRKSVIIQLIIIIFFLRNTEICSNLKKKCREINEVAVKYAIRTKFAMKNAPSSEQ